jgi:hypothetical protein
MQQVESSRRHSIKPIAIASVAAVSWSYLVTPHLPHESLRAGGPEAAAITRATEAGQQEAAGGAREAFLAAYKVFMHPRCMNCHPAGDAPLQGEDSHPHSQNVKRGPEGKGKYALKCANCHQDKNLPGENMPPGNPNWRLPAPDMPLVFQGRSPAKLAQQLKDPKQNGNKSLDELLHHVSDDKLVKGCWDPGDGRARPPLSHAEFVRRMRAWIENGAPAPD